MPPCTGWLQAISKWSSCRAMGCSVFRFATSAWNSSDGWRDTMTPQSYSGRGRTERKTSPEPQIFISHVQGGLTWTCQAHQPEDLKPLVKLMEQIPCGFMPSKMDWLSQSNCCPLTLLARPSSMTPVSSLDSSVNLICSKPSNPGRI